MIGGAGKWKHGMIPEKNWKVNIPWYYKQKLQIVLWILF
jgi:hypothetical protein